MLNRQITEENGIYSHEFFLAAGECNAESVMPLTFLVNRLIRVATEHANATGLGYSRFAPMGQGWVLTKLAVEMRRYPRVNERYTIKTWIEDANRLFSFRPFAIFCGDEVVGYARSEWAIIDMTTRCMCDLTEVKELFEKVRPDIKCPILPVLRIRPVIDGHIADQYVFTYCDVDFNRHVNTVRYIERLMDLWPMEHHDRYRVARFEIVFMRECHYGTKVDITVDDCDLQNCCAEITNGSVVHCRARFKWEETA